MLTYNLSGVQSISIFLTFVGVLTFLGLAARIVGTLRDGAKPVITFVKCTSLPSYQQSPNTIDIMLNGQLWGRLFPYKQGYGLTAKPNAEGRWTIKRHIMLDVAGTKELVKKLAAS